MRKQRAIIAASALLLAAGSLTCALASGGERTVPESEAAYLLRAENGRVTVWQPGRAAPTMQTEIELSTLREADRALIEAGYPVSDAETLAGLLEDLGS